MLKNLTKFVESDALITCRSLLDPSYILFLYIPVHTKRLDFVLKKRKEIMELKNCIYKGKEYKIIGTEHTNVDDYISHIGVLLDEKNKSS